MNEDDERNEEQARLECQMIDAVNELMAEHGYSQDDIEKTLAGTCFG